MKVMSIMILIAVVMGCKNNTIQSSYSGGSENTCIYACDTLKRLGCEEAEYTDMNKSCRSSRDCGLDQQCKVGWCIMTCVQRCMNAELTGQWIDTACVTSLTSCDNIDYCLAPKQTIKHCDEESCTLLP